MFASSGGGASRRKSPVIIGLNSDKAAFIGEDQPNVERTPTNPQFAEEDQRGIMQPKRSNGMRLHRKLTDNALGKKKRGPLK